VFLKELYITTDIINNETVTVTDWWSLIFCPAILAVSYLVFSPIISNIATGVWSFLNTTLETKRKSLVNKISIMSADDKRKMLIALEKLKEKHAEEKQKLQDEIDGYRNLDTISHEQNIATENSGSIDGEKLIIANKVRGSVTNITNQDSSEASDFENQKILPNKTLSTRLRPDTVAHNAKIGVFQGSCH
jgi:hypothetical protein